MLFPFNDLPTGDRAIVTVEEMIAFCGALLGETTTETYIPVQGAQARKVASIALGEDFNTTERYQILAAIPKKTGISDANAVPIWKRVGVLTNVAAPSAYLD